MASVYMDGPNPPGGWSGNNPEHRRVAERECGIKHTPGPWIINRVANSVTTPDGNNRIICHLPAPLTNPSMAADAALMAAAPEMLCALRAVMAEWRYGYGLVCVEQVRSAIARAEGRA